MNRLVRQGLVDGTLLALAVASGIAVVAARHWQANRPNEEPLGALIPALAETPPSRLVLLRDGKSTRVSHPNSPSDVSTWVIQDKFPAETSMVDAAITALRDIQVVRRIRTETQVGTEELSRLGLEHPNFSWQVRLDNSVWTIAFGAEAPQPRGGTYVDVTSPTSTSHQLYVATVDISRLAVSPEQLIEPRLLPYVPSDFGTVTLESEPYKAKFQFDTARFQWFEAEGQRHRISRTAIDSLLLQLTTLKGTRFESALSAGTHLVKHAATFTLGMRSRPATITLTLGEPCPPEAGASLTQVEVGGELRACTDARALLRNLERGPSAFVDSRLFSLRTDEVESLDEKIDGRSLHLARWESGFEVTRGDRQPLDLESGNHWLEQLLATHGVLESSPALEFANFNSGNEIRVRSAVVGNTDHYEEQVSIGQALANGDRYVKREMDGAVLRVSASEVRSLTLDEKRLKETAPSRDGDAGRE